MNQSFDELKSSNAFALHFALAFLSVIIIIGRVGMYLYLRPVHSSLVIRLFTSFHSKVFDCYNCISESLARQFREFPCTRFYLMPAYLIVSAEMWKLCNLPIVRLGNSGSPICNRFDVSSSAVCYFLQQNCNVASGYFSNLFQIRLVFIGNILHMWIMPFLEPRQELRELEICFSGISQWHRSSFFVLIFTIIVVVNVC